MIIASFRNCFTPRLNALVGAVLLLASGFTRSETVFESPKESVRLVELFTSEGCNSCPPADAWLSSLRESEDLWSRYVPVAFHVTYWDSLGWRDRFGQRAFDTLHETTAAGANAPVYTPAVFVAGKEWRSWRHAPLAIDGANDGVAGVLRVDLGDEIAAVTFDSPNAFAHLGVDLVWLHANQTTQVRRGENAGKNLHHEFVAHAMRSTPMEMADHIWRASVPASAADRNSSQAIAIWVVDSAGRPVQATGGWLQNASRDADAR